MAIYNESCYCSDGFWYVGIYDVISSGCITGTFWYAVLSEYFIRQYCIFDAQTCNSQPSCHIFVAEMFLMLCCRVQFMSLQVVDIMTWLHAIYLCHRCCQTVNFYRKLMVTEKVSVSHWLQSLAVVILILVKTLQAFTRRYILYEQCNEFFVCARCCNDTFFWCCNCRWLLLCNLRCYERY